MQTQWLISPSPRRAALATIRLATKIGSHVDLLLGGYYTHERSPYLLQSLEADPAGQSIGLDSHSAFFHQQLCGADRFTFQTAAAARARAC